MASIKQAYAAMQQGFSAKSPLGVSTAIDEHGRIVEANSRVLSPSPCLDTMAGQLCTLMRKLRLTQAGLEKAAGVGQGTLTQLLKADNTRTPTQKTWGKFRALDQLVPYAITQKDCEDLWSVGMMEVSPCPYCSSDNIELRKDTSRCFVLCKSCGARGPLRTESDAIKLWNALKTPAQSGE